MDIDISLVKELESLGRICLDGDGEAAALRDLGEILDKMTVLEKLDSDGNDGLSADGLCNVLRADCTEKSSIVFDKEYSVTGMFKGERDE